MVVAKLFASNPHTLHHGATEGKPSSAQLFAINPHRTRPSLLTRPLHHGILHTIGTRPTASNTRHSAMSIKITKEDIEASKDQYRQTWKTSQPEKVEGLWRIRRQDGELVGFYASRELAQKAINRAAWLT